MTGTPKSRAYHPRRRLNSGSDVVVGPHPLPGILVGEEKGPGSREGPDDRRGEAVVEGGQTLASVDLVP